VLPASWIASPDAVQERAVLFPNGEKHTVWFRQAPAGVYRRVMFGMGGLSEDDKEKHIAELIAASLCEPDGNLKVTPAEALNILPEFALILLTHIKIVNKGVADPEKKAEDPGN